MLKALGKAINPEDSVTDTLVTAAEQIEALEALNPEADWGEVKASEAVKAQLEKEEKAEEKS